MGCLPLALEQAGAYICASGETLAHYLALFRKHRLALLQRGAKPAAYPDTVATAWEMAFQAIEQERPTAADLLNLCAFLAPEEIPFDLLREKAAKLPEDLAATISDDLKFNDAVAALRRYSLIVREGEKLSVHRLVQAVTRDRLPNDDTRKKWATAALNLVNAAFPFESHDVRTWPACALLLGHALVAEEYAEALGVAPEETARLLNQAGLYLIGRADFAAAEPLMRRALVIMEKSRGKEHPKVATASITSRRCYRPRTG